MLDICVNIIARNSDDTIKMCLESVLPHVKRCLLTIDSRSLDETESIARELALKYSNLEVDKYPVLSSQKDIIKMRNHQVARVKEPWIWIVDSDEIYPEETIKQIELDPAYDVYELYCWAIWNRNSIHKSTSKLRIPRIFKMNPNRMWARGFGKEKFHTKNDKIKTLDIRYVHFTHVKKDKWRIELKQERMADGKRLSPIPLEIKKIVDQYYENNQK